MTGPPGFAVLALALLLATPAAAEGFCTAQWSPVCAKKNGVEQTYSNLGCAKADAAEVVRQGRCEDSPPATPQPTPVATPTPTSAPMPITPIPITPTPVTPAPVTPTPITPTPITPMPVTPEPIFCTEDYAPVCAVKDGASKTYSNACRAHADGATVGATGECAKP